MENALAGQATVVHDQPESITDTLLPRDFSSSQHQVAQQALVFRPGVGQAGDVLTRDHQDVCWSLRVDIPKSNNVVILVDDLGRGLAAGNLAEDAIRAHTFPDIQSGCWSQHPPG